MSSPLGDDLYREIVLDHARRPRRHGRPTGETGSAEGVNPLCGDALRIGIIVDEGRITDYGFEGSGCAISQASASLLGGSVIGCDIARARALMADFEALMRGEQVDDGGQSLGELTSLEGVAQFPMRVKCATLATKTLDQAIDAAMAGETSD